MEWEHLELCKIKITVNEQRRIEFNICGLTHRTDSHLPNEHFIHISYQLASGN